MVRGKGIVVLIEDFECDRNAIIITNAQYTPYRRCSRINSYSLKIDKNGRVKWIGEGCRHYNGKVGKKLSTQEALEIIRKRRRKIRETINKDKTLRHQLMIATRYILSH